MYIKIDKNTKNIMTNLFGQSSTAHLVESSKQTDGTDCGLFVIANATALAFKINPTEIMFDHAVYSAAAPCKLHGRKKLTLLNHRPRMHTWFLEIALVCVLICVCATAPKAINNQWLDIV